MHFYLGCSSSSRLRNHWIRIPCPHAQKSQTPPNSERRCFHIELQRKRHCHRPQRYTLENSFAFPSLHPMKCCSLDQCVCVEQRERATGPLRVWVWVWACGCVGEQTTKLGWCKKKDAVLKGKCNCSARARSGEGVMKEVYMFVAGGGARAGKYWAPLFSVSGGAGRGAKPGSSNGVSARWARSESGLGLRTLRL